MEISLSLNASNSSGEQSLVFSVDGEGTVITLVGNLNGQLIQVDFDAIGRKDTLDLISFLKIMTKR